jgi:DNA-directed RNA polymerase subunit N (RpoN/RPB10)
MDFPIPIRCYTCNLPIAGKWLRFLELVKEYRREDGRPEDAQILYLTHATTVTAEGRAMTDLGLTRECCRRHFLTHPGV